MTPPKKTKTMPRANWKNSQVMTLAEYIEGKGGPIEPLPGGDRGRGAGGAPGSSSTDVMPVTLEEAADLAIQGVWKKAQSPGWVAVTSVVDSGCVHHVPPPEWGPDTAIRPSAMSTRGKAYHVANGEELPNLGEKTATIYTSSGGTGTLTTQIAEVSKPLTSVGQLCDNGNFVLFTSTGGAVCNMGTGQVTPFERSGGNYELTYFMPAQNDGGPVNPATQSTPHFQRQGA